MSAVTRILVLEDVSAARRWLVQLASRAFHEQKLHFTEAESLKEADAAVAAADAPFDVALVDLALTDGNGAQFIARLAECSPQTTSVVTTIMASDDAITAALRAGAQGFLLKNQPETLLVRQLQMIHSGIPAISPPIARRIMQHFATVTLTEDDTHDLTPRELEILTLIAKGMRVVDAAESIGVAHSTVASHIKSIYRKLGISTRAEATLHASRMGLVG